MTLEERFEQLKLIESDIWEHLQTLYEYASKCNHITELGMRYGVSTLAFLIAKPEKLISCDINYCQDIVNEYIEYSASNNFIFEFIHSNDLAFQIEETDLLFIDTLHNYSQLRQEFELHASKVKKYIIMHDTISFGNKDESGPGPGLLKAIEKFLQENTNWHILEHREFNNGLMILERT